MTHDEIEFKAVTINGRLMTEHEFMAYLNGRSCAHVLLPIKHFAIIKDDLQWAFIKGYSEAYLVQTWATQ